MVTTNLIEEEELVKKISKTKSDLSSEQGFSSQTRVNGKIKAILRIFWTTK